MSEDLKGIKTIIFDLGNVIIDLHYERAARRFAELSGLQLEELNQVLVSSDLLKIFEVGGMSEAEFRGQLCSMLNLQLEDVDFDKIWNSLLGDISKERVTKMLELKGRFRTFVLSNTNAIHLRNFDEALLRAHGFNGIHELVDKAFYSHEVGMRKPNAEIYEFVLSDQKLIAKEVLFIDDREDNIEEARKLGIQVFLNEKIDDWMNLKS